MTAEGTLGDGRRDDAPVDRRQFLRRAAIVGTAAWSVPTIVTMQPALAASVTSPPPRPRRGSGDSAALLTDEARPAPAVGGIEITPATPGAGGGATGDAATTASGASTPHATVGSLALTGANIDRAVITGLGAIAAGAGLVVWSADRELGEGPSVEAADDHGDAVV